MKVTMAVVVANDREDGDDRCDDDRDGPDAGGRGEGSMPQHLVYSHNTVRQTLLSTSYREESEARGEAGTEHAWHQGEDKD